MAVLFQRFKNHLAFPFKSFPAEEFLLLVQFSSKTGLEDRLNSRYSVYFKNFAPHRRMHDR